MSATEAGHPDRVPFAVLVSNHAEPVNGPIFALTHAETVISIDRFGRKGLVLKSGGDPAPDDAEVVVMNFNTGVSIDELGEPPGELTEPNPHIRDLEHRLRQAEQQLDWQRTRAVAVEGHARQLVRHLREAWWVKAADALAELDALLSQGD